MVNREELRELCKRLNLHHLSKINLQTLLQGLNSRNFRPLRRLYPNHKLIL